jgi:hypothetical protein
MVPQSFLVLRFATAPPRHHPTTLQSQRKKCVPADSTALCAWLACFVAGAEGQAHAVEPSTLSSFTVSALPEAVLRHHPTSVLHPPRGPLSLGVESAPGTELAKRALRPKGSYWYGKQTLGHPASLPPSQGPQQGPRGKAPRVRTTA